MHIHRSNDGQVNGRSKCAMTNMPGHSSHAAATSVSSSSVPRSSLLHPHAFVQLWPVPRTESRWKCAQFSDEHLIDGDGCGMHKMQTLLGPDETGSSSFAAKHTSFSCP